MEAVIAGHGRGQFVAHVSESTLICREHYRLVLRLPEFPPTQPGQFVQIQCRDVDDLRVGEREIDWDRGQRAEVHDPDLIGPLALLRRPFSLAGRRDLSGGVELEIIHRVVGIGTHWLGELRIGDQVGIIGPLGNQFTLPAKQRTAILVGGGVGIPPMLYLASTLGGREAVAFAGALTRDLLPLEVMSTPTDPLQPQPIIQDFARHGIPTVISTDDGSFGFRGYVTQALEQYLDRAKPNAIIYTCGPEPMMKRVAAICAARGIECQIAVERAMACGMGTCQSCCIRVKKPDPSKPPLAGSDWCYRLACTDGPVFRGSELLW